MEHRHFSRLIGVIYLVGAVFGLVISIGGLVGLWSNKAQVTDGITGTVNLVSQALDATNQTLQVVIQSLDQASTNLDLIDNLLVDTGGSLKQSQGLVNDTASMVGVDMVNIVHQTQSSLESAGSNLRVVDDTLRLISRIPFIGANYKPNVPLQQSFTDVSRSLDPLPSSFNNIKQKLNSSAANIGTMQAELDTIAKQIGGIQSSIKDAKQVAGEYRLIIGDLQTRFQHFQKVLPDYLNVAYLGLTALLIWMLITQIGMALSGIQMMG